MILRPREDPWGFLKGLLKGIERALGFYKGLGFRIWKVDPLFWDPDY